MTGDQFTQAIKTVYNKVKKKYGGDAASRASVAVIEKGHDAFDSPEKLYSYFFTCAHGYRDKEYKREWRERRKKYTIPFKTSQWDNHSDLEIDLDRAIRGYERDIQDGLRSYFLEGYSLNEASQCLGGDLSRSSKRSILRQAINSLLEGDLRDYARPE